MKSTLKRLPAILAVVLLLVTSACGGGTTTTDDGEDLAAKLNTALVGSFDEQWDLILELAREEGEVNFETWCGNENINRWYDTWVIPQMDERYGITLNRICGAGGLVDRLLAERQEGVMDANDVNWTNGWTSQQMIQEGLMYGPIAYRLPNYVNLVDVNAPDLTVDFGFPNRGYESPYTRTEFTLFYDSANVDPVPANLEELTEWIMDNPGRFTYPDPSVDFTGDAFMKTIFYATNSLGGPAPFLVGFDEEMLEDSWGPTWEWFNDIKPYLWREGETYPASMGELEVLLQNGEVDWTMSYGPFRGTTLIAEGKAPDTLRALVLDDGHVSNANFLSIYFNAPHKAAAMVFLNFILEPETQLQFFDPVNWGNMPSIDLERAGQEWIDAFAAVDIGAASASLEQLVPRALPEVNSAYAEPLQQGWVANVLEAD
jgi:putative spermidine/putrescine transport system substrate-binding protein